MSATPMGFLADVLASRYTVPSPTPCCAALCCDAHPGKPLCPKAAYSGAVHDHTRLAEALGPRTCIPQSSVDTLGNQDAFKRKKSATDPNRGTDGKPICVHGPGQPKQRALHSDD